MAAFITINGVEIPAPAYGLGFIVTTTVDSARNSNNVVVGQKVGRDQQKINNVVWLHLDAVTWSTILKLLENFYVTVKYPDMVNNTWTTRKMYVGDRTAEVYKTDPVTKLPTEYINCKANLIDVGEDLG